MAYKISSQNAEAVGNIVSNMLSAFANKANDNDCELSQDTKFLHALGLMNRPFDANYCRDHLPEVEFQVNAVIHRLKSTKDGFTSTGFKVEVKSNGKNEYFVGNWAQPACPREVMYEMICNAVGKPDFNFRDYL